MSSAVFIFLLFLATVAARDLFALDARWICNVKQTCHDCLQLPHCSWCGIENKCLSKELPNGSCQNETIDHVDYGLSIVKNADCSCARGDMDLQCYPPGAYEGPQCSGRGQCVCGHCVCLSTPEAQYPTKTIMGEYCEFDNFSCNGSKCNEGPYSLFARNDDDDDDVHDNSPIIEDKELRKSM